MLVKVVTFCGSQLAHLDVSGLATMSCLLGTSHLRTLDHTCLSLFLLSWFGHSGFLVGGLLTAAVSCAEQLPAGTCVCAFVHVYRICNRLDWCLQPQPVTNSPVCTCTGKILLHSLVSPYYYISPECYTSHVSPDTCFSSAGSTSASHAFLAGHASHGCCSEVSNAQHSTSAANDNRHCHTWQVQQTRVRRALLASCAQPPFSKTQV